MWCDTPNFWHHVSPDDNRLLWQFDADWTGRDLPRFSDYYMHFVNPYISRVSIGWDILSSQLQIPVTSTNSSPEACAAACEREKEFDCVQWRSMPGRCYLNRYLQSRAPEEPNGSGHGSTSGWLQGKIESMLSGHHGCEGLAARRIKG